MNDAKKQRLADIERIAHEVAASLGLEIVELVFHSQGRHSLLRIDIDRAGLPGVGLSDCEALSRGLDSRIDELPFFDAPYELQVSSPGIDRPIKTDDDLRRNAGRHVRVEYEDDAGKIREAAGTLAENAGDGAITLTSAAGEIRISRDRIVLMKQDVTLGSRKRNIP
jgi:ribosome maturation factor RimP